MPTENRSSNEQKMVSFPRELSEDLAELIAEKARVCGGGAYEIWEAICSGFGSEAAQHQGEPVALPARQDDDHLSEKLRDKAEGWNDCLDEIAKLGPLYKHADSGEVERLRKATSRVQRMVECAGSQPSVATGYLRDILELLNGSAEPSTPVERDERSPKDYAIEHAEYMAKSADDVVAKYQSYSLTLLTVDEGGDDGEGELFEAIDSARGDLQESLVNLRSMVYEFRKRSAKS